MNPMQKYPHVIELFLCPINFSISLGAWSTPILTK